MRQFESGSTELAATLFSRCLRDGRLTKVNQALIHEYRGRALLKTGRVEDAITDFSHAISLTPSFALAYFSRGNAYARQGNHDYAIADYTAAIRLRPNYPEALHNRGHSQFERGQFAKAISDYSAAIELDSRFAFAYYQRGRAFGALGYNDEAIADFDSALSIAPKAVPALYYRGAAYFAAGRYEASAADFLATAKLHPQDRWAGLWLALLEHRAGIRTDIEVREPHEKNEWPRPLAGMLRGTVSAKAAIAAAGRVEKSHRGEAICAARFFAGVFHVANGRNHAAASLLREASRRCAQRSPFLPAARGELDRLSG